MLIAALQGKGFNVRAEISGIHVPKKLCREFEDTVDVQPTAYLPGEKEIRITEGNVIQIRRTAQYLLVINKGPGYHVCRCFMKVNRTGKRYKSREQLQYRQKNFNNQI